MARTEHLVGVSERGRGYVCALRLGGRGGLDRLGGGGEGGEGERYYMREKLFCL